MTPGAGLPGWERLRHGGLLLDGARLEAVSRHGNAPAPLDAYTEGKLRQRAGAMLDGARTGSGDGGESGGSGAGSGGERGDSGAGGGSGASSFVAFVLEQVCGFDASTGTWTRGSNVAPAEGRRAVTGETVKPRHLWTGRRGARLPVFLDGGRRLGVGRGRRIVSQVLGWLRAGGDHLALVTNGRQWRLVFAGLDHDAWCEWDLDLWFEEGALSPQVTVLRTLLRPELWTPPSEGVAGEGPPSEGPTGTDPGGTDPAPPPPLLQCIRDTRKGQAELSEVLGERVREAVELLIRGHGEALKAHCASVAPADVYRAACRVAMRLVVILFAESRDLLPRDNVVYHESYGLNGLLEGLERAAARGGAPAAGGISAWPRVLALFRLVREGSHHPDLPVAAYGGDLFAPGARGAGAAGDAGASASRPVDSPGAESAPTPGTRGASAAGDAGLRIRKDALAPGVSGAETARDAGTSASRPVDSPDAESGPGPGPDPESSGAADGLSQALAVFESACFESGAEVMPDRDVHEVLTLLTRTTIRIRQGRGGVRAVVPVDFSDLSSEYIGILYEGLLDYELKTAPPGDPVIFLSVGDQPALPLSRLEAMDERALKALFESLKEDRSTAADAGDAADAAGDVDTGDTAETAGGVDVADAAGVAENQPEGDAALVADDLPEGEDGGEPAGREPEPPEASGEATRSRAGTEGGAPPPDDALLPGVRAGVREAAPEYLASAAGPASGLALEPVPGLGTRAAAPEYHAPPVGAASGLALEPAPGPDARAATPEYLAPAPGSDERQRNRTRAERWARRAAQAAGLVRKPRGRDTPERRLAFDARIGAKARQLVARVVLPGEWYLVRWGGTRKGSGSFYTRPGLAVPTVQRTLRPLAFDPPPGAGGAPDRDAPPARWTPKLPERILDVKVCDPACGSGTFPLAALRFLTDALYASLQHHGRIEADGERALIRLLGISASDPVTPTPWERGRPARSGSENDRNRLAGSDESPGNAGVRGRNARPAGADRSPPPEARHMAKRAGRPRSQDTRLPSSQQVLGSDPAGLGEAASGEAGVDRETATAGNGPAPATPGPRLGDELIPCRPDDDTFESRLKAVLRRHVVERCLYAVDLDPLAVELCRLSLWIETMDRTLPFGFLDHKIKCGNALIGAWFDRFPHYPAMAWKNREGGDRNHGNGVHFEKNARTKAIKAFVKDRLTPDLKLFLRGPDLFAGDLLRKAATAHDDALAALADMHALPVQDAAERARIYRERFLESPAWRALKAAMDLWCACWFWPAEEIEHAPLPTAFADPPPGTRVVAERIAAEMRFFHWELEFPDVFREAGSGFDAILGNPPWENLQSNPEEFFSNWDPLFRTYGRLEKSHRQQNMFRSDRLLESHYLDYMGSFKDFSNWVGNCVNPFGDPESTVNKKIFALGKGGKALHHRWRSVRQQAHGYSDASHPFRFQMGRIFTYQLFVEQSLALMNTGGRCGIIIPSGIYSDAWSRPLRDALLQNCRWEWLFGMENRSKVFPIHRSYKFNAIIVEKGSVTDTIRTAFMRRNVDDWERAEDFATPYTLAQIMRFSPKSRALLEIQSNRDLELIEKIYANAVLLGDDSPDGWRIKYNLEFMMNTDAHLFPPRPQWEAKGYRPDEYSRWLLGDWRPIEELWATLGVDPARPEPAEIVLEDWLFDTTAGPERRTDEARFAHGHLLKPGDVARTDWRLRCAQPPYDRLPVPRARIPAGVVLSREGDAWIRDSDIREIALPVYQGIMVQPFVPSARGWLSGTGLRAKWDYHDLGNLRWNPQFLMAQDVAGLENRDLCRTKIGYREVARSTDARSFIGAVLPSFPCGHKVPILHVGEDTIDGVSNAGALFNSFVFDWLVRQRLGAAALAWYVLAESALPPVHATPGLLPIIKKLNLFPNVFAGARVARTVETHDALHLGERIRLRSIVDAVSCAIYGCDTADLRHILRDSDLPASHVASRPPVTLDARGFWRVDRDKDPELRHTVLTLIAFHDLQAKIEAAGGDRGQGIEAFLAQNDGEGWMLPETLRLADHGLGHDERARHPQPVAGRLGPRFHDWQLARSTEESRRECHLHARNLLGAHDYALLLAEVIERRAADRIAAGDGDDCLDLLTDPFTRTLTGEGGYVTALLEVRARNLLDETAWWTTVDDLRTGGYLAADRYSQLLDSLHARGLLDDLGYRRRRGHYPPAPSHGPLPRVAEPEADYHRGAPPKDDQTDLFE